MIKFKRILIQLLYYTIFHMLIWGLHLIVLSIVAFFHFDLEHSMTIIDDWIFSEAWILSFISTALAGFIMIKVLLIKSNFRNPISSMISASDRNLSAHILVIIIFILGSFLYWGRPDFKIREDFEFLKLILSYMGSIFIYFVDICILFLLDHFYPLKLKEKVFRVLTFPFLFLFFSKSTYYLEPSNLKLVYFYSFLLLICFSLKDLNWKNSIVILFTVIAPLNAFFGLDVMWGDAFSPFIFKNPIDLSMIIVISILSFSYWLYSDWRQRLKAQ